MKQERLGADRTPTPPPWADLSPPQNNAPGPLTPRSSEGHHVHEAKNSKKHKKRSRKSDKSLRNSPNASYSPENEHQTDSEIMSSPRVAMETEHTRLTSNTPVLNNNNRVIGGSLTNRSPLPDLSRNDRTSPGFQLSPTLEGVTDFKDPVKRSSPSGRGNSPQKDQDILDRSIHNLLY